MCVYVHASNFCSLGNFKLKQIEFIRNIPLLNEILALSHTRIWKYLLTQRLAIKLGEKSQEKD